MPVRHELMYSSLPQVRSSRRRAGGSWHSFPPQIHDTEDEAVRNRAARNVLHGIIFSLRICEAVPLELFEAHRLRIQTMHLLERHPFSYFSQRAASSDGLLGGELHDGINDCDYDELRDYNELHDHDELHDELSRSLHRPRGGARRRCRVVRRARAAIRGGGCSLVAARAALSPFGHALLRLCVVTMRMRIPCLGGAARLAGRTRTRYVYTTTRQYTAPLGVPYAVRVRLVRHESHHKLCCRIGRVGPNHSRYSPR